MRGFASFKELSHISEPSTDVQRALIEEHKGEMAAFLNKGEYRFFPEVILSLVLSSNSSLEEINSFLEAIRTAEKWNQKLGDFNISISRNVTKEPESGQTVRRINVAHISFDETKVRLSRIDGNHRLSAADEVNVDFDIPFCILLFRTSEENDQFSRAIFHNINAKQIPLKLEENLKVIIESVSVFSNSILVNDPSFGAHYYLARKLIREVDMVYFPNINVCIFTAKYTFFVELFKYLIENKTIEPDGSAIGIVKSQLVEIEKALAESQITCTTDNIAVLGALAYYKLTHPDKYRHFISWIKKNNIGDIELLHIDDVIKIYDKVYLNAPKKAFLARWYPLSTENEFEQSEKRLKKIIEVTEELNLELVDLGTQLTGTFDIRSVMYQNIEDCDIFIADLSGARHNVMVEVGYALKHIDTGRMVFYFQKTEKQKTVPFDVSGFSYDKINDSDDILTKTRERLINILEKAKAGEI